MTASTSNTPKVTITIYHSYFPKPNWIAFIPFGRSMFVSYPSNISVSEFSAQLVCSSMYPCACAQTQHRHPKCFKGGNGERLVRWESHRQKKSNYFLVELWLCSTNLAYVSFSLEVFSALGCHSHLLGPLFWNASLVNFWPKIRHFAFSLLK